MFPENRSYHRILLAGIAAAGMLSTAGILSAAAPAANADPRDDASPWGMGTSAEWSGEYAKYFPLLNQAGVTWMRQFPEWQGIQPKQGEWNWAGVDSLLETARANKLHLMGYWGYFARFASADGGTRKGPVRDMQFWRDYITGTVQHCKKDIKYWEVWNEFNGSFYVGKDKPKEYADLVVEASKAAKKVDPTAKIGMSVANFDVGFLDAAIKAGAAGHFDFLCVHPYENLGTLAVEGGEMGYLSLAANLRSMLKANKQNENMPLWITEVGYPAPVKPDPVLDAKQAGIVVKGHLLTIVQGFNRIAWFEARGPSYGKAQDLAIIRPDWTLRPSYVALKTMISLLGQEPKYLGWLDLGKGGMGFLFSSTEGNVLAAWATPTKENKTTFPANVRITDLTGAQTTLPAGKELTLTPSPVFIGDVPPALSQQAIANVGKPFPWGGDYARTKVVKSVLGAINQESGLTQRTGTTVVVNGLTDSCRRTDIARKGGEGKFVYFRVDPQFVPYGTNKLTITVVARNVGPGKPASTNLIYEAQKGGYISAKKCNAIPGDDKWHELKWELTDANFCGQWGWNFRLDANGSPNDFCIKEVRVEKP